MIEVDEWGDEDTVWGQFANAVLYYPSIDLKMKEMRTKINWEMKRTEREITKISMDEAKEMEGFKLCAKKGIDYKELEKRSRLVSGHRARKRRQLTHKEAYQRCLQEIEEVERLKKETTSVNEISRMLAWINRRLPLHKTQQMLRRFEMEKDKLNTKSEWVEESLEDEDPESENKIHDSDELIQSLCRECKIDFNALPCVPQHDPRASSSRASDSTSSSRKRKGKGKGVEAGHVSKEDEALFARVASLENEK